MWPCLALAALRQVHGRGVGDVPAAPEVYVREARKPRQEGAREVGQPGHLWCLIRYCISSINLLCFKFPLKIPSKF